LNKAEIKATATSKVRLRRRRRANGDCLPDFLFATDEPVIIPPLFRVWSRIAALPREAPDFRPERSREWPYQYEYDCNL